MLFSGIPFLYYFLPCVLIVYFIAPKKIKNAVLLVSSLFFYGWGEPRYILLMVISIICGYVSGLLIERLRSQKAAKAVLWVSAAIDLGCLAFFKYADFFIENFSAVTGLSIPALRIALPIGISFYTFQILSYTIDVYRKDVAAQKNIIDLAAYISMFPQLIAGPIVRYSDIEKQLKDRTHTIAKTSEGIRLFVIGLGKKILIANSLGELCAAYTEGSELSVMFCWMYALSYSLQIYFDFSGYSDMAIGLGKIFGFDFPANFRHPFISGSITEFWRRWHISLGTWFRDYVYIPLGGNRVSKLCHIRNILVVWALTGLWHGAAWNFVIWGLYFAVLLTVEKFFILDKLKKFRVIGHVYVIFAIMISFVIFGSEDMRSALRCISGMFGAEGLPLVTAKQVYLLKSFLVVLIAAMIGSTPLPGLAVNKISGTKYGAAAVNCAEIIFLAAVTLTATAYLVDGSFNPFLYFRF